MKKNLFSLALIPLILLTSCGEALTSEEETTYIHVLNAEDYIDDTLLDDFSSYIEEKYNDKVEVIYDTYDTNETMYNTIKTGKTTYDAICCSDYMIQRLVKEDLATYFDYSLLPNYSNYVSSFLYNKDGSGKLNEIEVETTSNLKTLDNYAIGYMWGTLGILYNPKYILDKNESLFNKDETYSLLSNEERIDLIIDTFNGDDGYSFLWSDLLKGTQSIKDSMRDSYAMGIFEVYKDYFLNTTDSYIERNEKFNSSDNETIELVKNKLIELKSNIFGFEVDSGKNDIVTQKIGVNLAWSGDAVNSINRGHYIDEDFTEEREEDIELYYSIPSVGANIWFDAWCLPTHEEGYRDSKEYKYAMEFLDYLSLPTSAIRNVYYNGYTSFIGANISDEDSTMMLEYMLYSYDLSLGDEEINKEDYDSYDITPFFQFDEEFSVSLSRISQYFEDEEIDERTYTFKKDENGEVKILIYTDLSSFEGRCLKAQYPESKDIDSLYVMRDFGNQNDAIVSMWEDVKVNPLPTWIVITLLLILFLFLGYLGSYKLIKLYRIKKRKSYRNK